MTIYVDVSSAVHGKAGLGRYARSLAAALRPLLGDRLGLFYNGFGRAGPLPGMEAVPAVGVRWGYKPWRAMVLAGQLLGARMDRLLPGGALYHATEHLLPPLRRMPTVLTVHDLIYERFPEHHKFMNYHYLRAAMPTFCRRAGAIIAISQATRDDLCALYGIAPERVTVIPEAAAPHFGPQTPERVAEVRARYGLPASYMLTVGTIEPRKNLSRLADVCGPVFARGLADALVIVGARGWLYEGFYSHLHELPWRDRILFPGYVPDEDLPALYAGAALAVQPSLYEGFGLPLLEAMASGCPVCASRTSSHPEVGGDAARYFDPHRPDEMVAVLSECLESTEEREVLRQKGYAQAARFSWQATARSTMDLYQSLVSL